ncbi:MAG: AAA family ATPase [Lachnospiraceae bacterium]|nr:AAA family ATPase [Lachnospiraceae bacterium]
MKQLIINQYRKLKDLELNFTNGLNAISGTNGTCKSSLLHLISNSFQQVTKTCEWVKDEKCIQIINAVNTVTNPKVESLTRGDQQYNDPAHGVQGTLFTVEYYDREPLSFRRHNSTSDSRYAIKPQYKRGSGDKLPYCPIIYLGLPRLVPYGEFHNDEAVAGIKKSLPNEYRKEIADLYKDFTNYCISDIKMQQMGDVKVRSEFDSDVEGVDSNTISAGEDNLYIILTAIVSLKYYFESIESSKTIESILLIDEIDATLHPAYQIKILKLLRDYSHRYKIQVIFTTHSMSALEDMLNKKDNVIYLLDNISSVFLMDEPDIYKIKMHLSSMTSEDIYKDKVIPIFSEDAEARVLLESLFSYYENTRSEFVSVKRFFHMVNVNIGAENLINIFKDSKLLQMTMKSICILDGDHGDDLSNYIMSLPGKNHYGDGKGLPPEKLLFEYAEELYNNDDSFWTDRTIIERGFGKLYYLNNIKKEIEKYKKECEEAKKKGEKEPKKERVFNKDLFNSHIEFFKLLFKHWLHNPEHNEQIQRVYENLRTLFKKVSTYNEINAAEWKII